MPAGRFPPVVSSLEASALIVDSDPVEASQVAVSMPRAGTVSAVVAGWVGAHSAVAVSTVGAELSTVAEADFMAAGAVASMEGAVAGVSTVGEGEELKEAAEGTA